MMGEQNKCIIIGISGTTNSGKTSLVAKLSRTFPEAETICQDSYFLEPDDKRLEAFYVPEVDHANWEQFGALEMDRMIEDVEKWKQRASCDAASVSILIIEGFLIFNHSILKDYFHKKYFLIIDKEKCIQRRSTRIYNPPDKPGYFEKVVWPMYLINKKEMEAQTDIVYFDGTDDQEQVLRQIMEDIEQLVKSCSS